LVEFWGLKFNYCSIALRGNLCYDRATGSGDKGFGGGAWQRLVVVDRDYSVKFYKKVLGLRMDVPMKFVNACMR